MKLYIKNMIGLTCQIILSKELLKLGIEYKNLILGEVEIISQLNEEKLEQLDKALKNVGLELIIDKSAKLVEKIKMAITDQINRSEDFSKINLSVYLSKKLKLDYTYISNYFSKIEGTSIENYVINQKIEKAKEMLLQNELTISEIAWKLHFSSVQHLSNQFKMKTGISPSSFKNSNFQIDNSKNENV